jgi:pimeloyl-ACP methyl ester carboxylesterase
MKKIAFLLCISFFAIKSLAQRVPLKSISEKIKSGQKITAKDFGFTEYQLVLKNDTVNFYTYQKPNSTPTSIYLELPGSDARHIYSYHRDTDGSYWYSSLTRFDLSYLPDDFLFVIVAKPGFGFCGNGNSRSIPQKYWEMTSLQDRVMRANMAINYVRKNIVKKPNKITVFGYSEGFYVGAKMATMNKTITHLGIGGGGGFPDFYDFILSNQKDVMKGETVVDSAVQYNQEYVSNMYKVMADSASKKLVYGYTYKRWASFSEPAVLNLIKLKIPIYQVHGTDDENTPIESAYIVPIEFARLQKDNLAFKVYANCNHSLVQRSADGKETDHWDNMMNDFFKWVDAPRER